MNTFLGIDVSKWQNSIEWKKVKQSGINFAMLRASYGIENTDKYFLKNYHKAINENINLGAYHYCYANNIYEAKKEAEHFLKVIRNYKFTYPIALDLEDKCQNNISKNDLTNIAITFMQSLEVHKYYVILYCNKNWLENKLEINRLKNFDIWLAEWTPNKYIYNGNVGIWQYTNKGNINGINGNVDLNISYKDYPEIITKNNLNNIK